MAVAVQLDVPPVVAGLLTSPNVRRHRSASIVLGGYSHHSPQPKATCPVWATGTQVAVARFGADVEAAQASPAPRLCGVSLGVVVQEEGIHTCGIVLLRQPVQGIVGEGNRLPLGVGLAGQAAERVVGVAPIAHVGVAHRGLAAQQVVLHRGGVGW